MIGATSNLTPGAQLLEAELDRAVVKEAPSKGHVRLGSLVEYRDEVRDQTRTVELVMPDRADISQDRVSVFSPVGAALLGMAEQASIAWSTGGDRAGRLTILRVMEPAEDSRSDG